MRKKISPLVRFAALMLAIILVIPTFGSAAAFETVQPRASAYLTSYSAYVYLPGNGQVQVYFDVTGTDDMDELGVLSIKIYESTDGVNWTWKETFKHNTTAGMLSYNDAFHTGHVTYNGVVGRYYRAYVCVWGGKDGQGDTRYFWTSAKH